MRTHTLLGILQAFVAIGAIPAGISMILEPDGEGLGMSVDMLASSPFESFLIPGILLLLVNGIFHLTGAVLSFRNRRHAGTVGLFLGAALIVWIAVQIGYIHPVHFLQLLYLGIGIAECLLGYRIKSGQGF